MHAQLVCFISGFISVKSLVVTLLWSAVTVVFSYYRSMLCICIGICMLSKVSVSGPETIVYDVKDFGKMQMGSPQLGAKHRWGRLKFVTFKK